MTDNLINTNLESLSQISEEVTFQQVEESNIVKILKDCMNEGWVKGIGISAIQIDVPVRVAVYKKPGYKDKYVTLINPRITFMHDIVSHRDEGCLSLPNQRYQTWRYDFVICQTLTANGIKNIEARGLEAHVIQHEIDHMNGILCSSRVIKPKDPKRNDPCSCNSGRKFKKCCGGFIDHND